MTILARGLLAVVIGAAVALGGWGSPGLAHGPTGTMGIEVTPGPEPRTAVVRVLLEYANDREVAPGATVAATAVGPAGEEVGPVPLADRGQGVYEAALTLPAPGSWAVTVTADNPAARAEATVEVADAPAPPTTITVPGDLRASSDRSERAGDDADGGGTDLALVAAIVVVGALLSAGGVMLVRRRR